MARKKKVAAGGIVIRETSDKTRMILLVQHIRHKGWGFPKGHIDKGEEPVETALREVEEETGVVGQIMGSIGRTHYQFINAKKNLIDKTVYWYLMRFAGWGEQTHAHEVADVRWVPVTEVPAWLAFDVDRQLLARCRPQIDELELV